jgi:CyaY protein
VPHADALRQIDRTLEALAERFDALDHDRLDVDIADGKLTIEFEDGTVLIVNRQGAASQIWLAEPGGGWHFDWDGESWRCGKRGVELVANLEELISSRLGEPISLR